MKQKELSGYVWCCQLALTATTIYLVRVRWFFLPAVGGENLMFNQYASNSLQTLYSILNILNSSI